MVPVSIFAALMAVMAPAQAGFPGAGELQEALNELEKCGAMPWAQCARTHRQYKVHGAKCMTIPPEDGRPSVACRVDLTLTYTNPDLETSRHRDSCLRFARLEPGNVPAWSVLQIRDRACEIPTALKRDPNPVPARARLEHALVGYHTCYDQDGLTHCGPQPEKAYVEAFRCKPIARGAEREARAACRVTAAVATSNGRRLWHLEDSCLHLDRTTPADHDPAYWIIVDSPDKARCEVRRPASTR